MRVELIDDKEPRGLWSGGKGAGDRRRKVFFRSAGPAGRRHAFPRRPVEGGDPALRPMAEICLRRALDQTWLHRQGGGGTRQRLAPGLLLRPDAMASGLGHGGRLLIRCTLGSYLGAKCDGVSRLGVEPVLNPMRLQIRLILKNARHCGC